MAITQVTTAVHIGHLRQAGSHVSRIAGSECTRGSVLLVVFLILLLFIVISGALPLGTRSGLLLLVFLLVAVVIFLLIHLHVDTTFTPHTEDMWCCVG